MDEYIIRVKYETSMDVVVLADCKSEARDKARQKKHFMVLENQLGKVISCGSAFLNEKEDGYI